MYRILTALALFVSLGQYANSAPIEGAVATEGASFDTLADQNLPEKVTIALAADLSQAPDASASAYGHQLKKGIQLALSEALPRIKEANLDIEIQEFDSMGDNIKVVEVANAVMDSNAQAVIGHLFSSEALLAAEVYAAEPILFVSPGATAERLQFMGPHILSTVFNNLEQAKMLVNAAVEKGLEKAAIISVKDCAYCDNLRLHFEVEARRTSLEVIDVQNLLSDEADLESALDLEKLKAAQVIFLPNYEAANAKLIHFLSAKKIVPEYYLGGDGWGLTSKVFRELVGDLDFRAMSLAYWSPNLKEERAIDFMTRYQAKFDVAPSDSAVLAYDGMNRLIEVLLASERPITRASLLKAKDQVKKSEGALGPIINHEWVISRPYVILEYDGLEVIDTKVNRTEL